MKYKTFAAARQALVHGETSCEALVSSFLERIDARNDDLNAFLSVDRDGALNHARYLDSQRQRGNERPLDGLVLGVKDTISIRGQQLTCGSKMLADFTSSYDATVIARLREAGAIFIGKTNCDAFGMGSTNETSYFGPVAHPQQADYVPGGSSGGSAAAVAAGLCHAALGSDTGGSVRQPAAFCGAVGLKPTYGRVSRYGLVAYASSLDTIGPLTHSVQDAATLLGCLAGRDGHDATTASVPCPDYSAACSQPIDGLAVGLPQEYFDDALDADIERMIQAQVEALQDAGATVTHVSLPHTAYTVPTYYVLATAEASSNLARYDGVRYGHRTNTAPPADADALEHLYRQTRTEGFGDEVKRRIMVGTYTLSTGAYKAYYDKAQRVRRLIRNDFDRVFDTVDVLLAPVTPGTAFRKQAADDPLAMYRSDRYTVAANLAGVPGLALPIGAHPTPPHLPVGLQLLGRPFDEATLLQVGAHLERANAA
ncbi:Asp-tRNA(Asn)/Glu-tRNA(Gln) amidotransferase subunit GatA [Salisaeta longa]|uniref:Asp-tRNA(Asn)/Glu-tRNA(Gln) amidotransferase subunit GatA n=1 Tax=Salisaeta longa TaxID=503170 RepID=UPI0003B2EB42|nr:Asp-tRNA(Asn)/Glu-tRNA(Gln) amidotransferase subunit GatA [Salisaeta longa]